MNAVHMMGWLLLVLMAALASGERKSYEGYKIISIVPKNKIQLSTLQQWEMQQNYLDFHQHARSVDVPVNVLVPPQYLSEFTSRLTSFGFDFHVLKRDIQNELKEFWAQVDSRPQPYAVNLTTYNTLSEILPWLDQVAASCDSAAGVICQTYSSHYSYEGRPIKTLRISKAGVGRKAYYLDAAAHAREWLTTSTLMNIINHMITGYQIDPVVTRLVDAYDWYFLPVVNPDGYEYTWTTDRMWKKNRSPSANSTCVGVDLNKNFGYNWGTNGAIFDPCSDNYCGASAMSEPETRAVSNEAARLADSLRAYVFLHCIGQYWMHPWSFLKSSNGSAPQDCAHALDETDLLEVSEAAANAVQATHNTIWERGTYCEVNSVTGGTSIDHIKGSLGIKYSFHLELRGSSHAQPDTEILPSFQEVWNGIVAMVDKITEKHGP